MSELKVLIGSFLILIVFGWISEWYAALIGPEIFVGAFGASTAIFFHSPTDQVSSYKNLVLGYFVSCMIGLSCNLLIGSVVFKGACSVSLAIFCMRNWKIFHPAGGALAFLSATYHYQSPTELMGYLFSTAVIGPSLFFLLVLVVRKTFPMAPYEVDPQDRLRLQSSHLLEEPRRESHH